MSNQVSGTSTNFTKLVAWDIDEYNGFSSEEDCLICLSPQERYLLRNVLRQMKWRTRWTSELGTEYPDISTIAENLAYKLDEMNCIDFCQSIIDCINDPDSGVASSIQGLINAPAYDVSRETGQSENNTVLGAGYNPTCDKDILYGQCRQIVEYMNQINIDILEIIEVASNTLDAFSQVAGDMKGIDGSAVATAIDWIAFIQDNIQENYLANVTVTYLDNLACDFFCAASLISCELTPQMMYDILSNRLSNSFDIESLFNETLGYLITGAWVGSEIPDFMFLSQLALRSQLGKILQFSGYFDINARMQIYANDPDPDWNILCTDCADCILYDFRIDEQGWIGAEYSFAVYVPRSVYDSGNGWEAPTVPLRGQNGIQLDYVGTLDSIQVILDSPITGDRQWLVRVDGVNVINQIGSGQTKTFTFTTQTVTDNIQVFAIDNSSSSPTANHALFKIERVVPCGDGLPTP